MGGATGLGVADGARTTLVLLVVGTGRTEDDETDTAGSSCPDDEVTKVPLLIPS